MFDVDTVVIGAGAVGLAAARALAESGREVMVLERHGLIGSETSSRNSEVIHAGIYYPKGSLKAEFCVEGKERLYAYCAARGIGHRRCGKLIVATSEEQVAELESIAARAAANGVHDLAFLTRAEAQALEPALACEAALLSPSTGILDSHGYMQALEGDITSQGGQVVLHSCVAVIHHRSGGGFELLMEGAEGYRLSCRHLVVSAGLSALRLLSTLEGYPQRPFHMAKGNYFRLSARPPFSRLIYPVPEPGGLGVHLTLDLAGQGRFGPDVEWTGEEDYSVDPARAAGFYAAIRRYWPHLPDEALLPDYAGIRPKLTGEGEASADFLIETEVGHKIAGLVNLLGIESPGLTASLAIGARVALIVNDM
ncbi:NAD(P)/FAD-dependent oxidoreductase [Pannonibacter phragmitetus]|uniref:FAD-dependent oxidoreductase n=1 Tax=Pannonibacter phragmitetus TaxID=121719 RepID=A0A0U3FRX9_9HYPH|nr:NAD(P)/FAD-dependent oxidoreductase [Pannonibacter phragmitetus]ALV29022.1 FAD-dependent oxidoreductase [Pannonibacter phragmitetus]